MDLIRLNNITKTYHLGEIDVPVLKGISLTIERGELVALMGASGSGKSTLMNILGCLDRPTSGEYWLDGEEVSRLSSDQRAHASATSKIGFVFQSFNLLPRTSALENVMMPLTYTAAPPLRPRGRERGAGAAGARRPRRPHGPRARRSSPAASSSASPSPARWSTTRRCSSPTSRPATSTRKTSREMLQMFQRLNEEEGITIILVTHDANVAGTPGASSASATA